MDDFDLSLEDLTPAVDPADLPKRGRPPKGAKVEEPEAKVSLTEMERGNAAAIARLKRPVTVTFLMQVFGMTRATVIKRLASLPPIGHAKGGIALYDFRQALDYLATPRLDLKEYLKSVGVSDLPPSLQKDVWDAKLKEQKWRLQAGDLWRTEDVLEVLGEAFKRLRTAQQLWLDELTEKHNLTEEQRKDLAALIDALQADQHRALVEMPKQRATRSAVDEVPEDTDD